MAIFVLFMKFLKFLKLAQGKSSARQGKKHLSEDPVMSVTGTDTYILNLVVHWATNATTWSPNAKKMGFQCISVRIIILMIVLQSF